MVNLFFICPLNRKANLTNEHCTSESVFVACAHIASMNNLLGVQIPHPSFLSHNFSFNPPFSAVTLVYPSLETQGLWVDFKSGWKSPFRPDLKLTHSPWVSKDMVYLNCLTPTSDRNRICSYKLSIYNIKQTGDENKGESQKGDY